jgi:hypothetical protein
MLRRSMAVIAIALAGGCDLAENPPTKPPIETRRSHPIETAGKQEPFARSPKNRPLLGTESPPSARHTLVAAPVAHPNVAELAPLDEDQIAAQGIRRLEGQYLTLYTDLPVDAAIEALPHLFDLAVPQWRAYFKVDRETGPRDRGQPKSVWADQETSVRGCLMKDAERFTRAGLLPISLPQFDHAYTRGNELWWFEQDTDYYRAHLMLHEGTHAFMYAHFGDCGPPWYREGIAELIGTHRFSDGALTLGYFPAQREQVPDWGRIKIVRDAVQSGRALTIDEILAYTPDAHLQLEPYGWCWAIAAFLDGNPHYRERFRLLLGELKADDFNRQMRRHFADDWQELNLEWQVFIHEVDFGYDLHRNAVDFQASRPLSGSAQTVTIAADRGWQSSGIRLAAGTAYELTAAGRYQVVAEPKIWWCEPGGVSIRYHGGRPLGILMAIVLPDDADAVTAWPSPVAIGLAGTLASEKAGTLYFRINDSPAGLDDNAGSLEVTIRVK